MTWLDVLGWAGSALLIFSLMQARVLRFRVLNLIACLMLILFNTFLGIWPMVAMNAVLSAINTWFIVSLLRHRDDETAYTVLELGTDDAYLRHLLGVHGKDIVRFQPGFDPVALEDPATRAFIIQNRDETVGVTLVRANGDTADVLLDYVTQRYRDFTPGKFVWRDSGLMAEHGFRRVRTPAGMVGAYYDRLGFRRDGDAWVLEV